MSIKLLAKQAVVKFFDFAPARLLAMNLGGQNSLIFMLHRFQHESFGISSGHSPGFLRQCLETARRRGYNLTTVEDMVVAANNGSPLKNAIAFTVDDGYLDQAEIGGEIFADYDCPATYFLITDFIDGSYWPHEAKITYILEKTTHKELKWTLGQQPTLLSLRSPLEKKNSIRKVIWQLKSEPLALLEQQLRLLASYAEVDIPSKPPGTFAPMSWDQARALEKRGLRFGAHSRRHVILSNQDTETAKSEIIESIDAIRQNMVSPSNVFCYPTGRYCDFGTREKQIVEHAGCCGAISSVPGYHNPLTIKNYGGRFSVPRFSLPDNSLDFLQSILYLEYFKERLQINTRP